MSLGKRSVPLGVGNGPARTRCAIIHTTTTSEVRTKPKSTSRMVPTTGRHQACFAVRASRWYGVPGGAGITRGSRGAYGDGKAPYGC
ncbi:hypothetical protein [Kribbella sindirgiensis]|uniref:Uncharacterized protein n=1 Tax=Kribbella sindirgiensis TaxID=1124744 RepID=A0A4R0IBC1_9ACTN|nr:hypothetical protein [Kribbella sindirgiensis]TCC30381.1 hypothetical protein E0H50_23470 [Kribbella sindirgiensis]